MSKAGAFEELINREIENFCKQLNTQPAELYDPLKYTLSNHGKRVRPIITLLSCELFGGNPEKALNAAIALELFHNFTLIHDDLMDNAPLRRNQATVHEKWDRNIAVLSGDSMFIKSVELISKTPANNIQNILSVFSTTAMQVCEGQQLDMNYEKSHKIAVDQYLTMIELKTAVLLAASFKIGALIGEATENDAQHIYEFGKNLGIAFQLQDDILDVYGDEKKFGKQKGGDIIANKKTFLLVKAKELASNYIAEELDNWIFAPQFNPQDKIEAITRIYNTLKIKELAENEMQKYYTKALSSLNNISIKDEKKQDLIGFADKLIKREK